MARGLKSAVLAISAWCAFCFSHDVRSAHRSAAAPASAFAVVRSRSLSGKSRWHQAESAWLPSRPAILQAKRLRSFAHRCSGVADTGSQGAEDDRLRTILLAACIGLFAGCLAGALGLGGGFLVVPLFTFVFDVEPREAIGTSAAVVLAVSCTACQAYIARGLASFRASAAIASSALITARLGASLTARTKPKVLKRCFGAWLLVASALIGAKAAGLLTASVCIANAGAVASLPLLAVLGAATGFISGLLGVGGGTVLVPSLSLGFAFPQAEAAGCALLGMVPPSVVSVTTHWRKGNFNKFLAIGAVSGAVIGGALGSNLAAQLPEQTLRIVFAVVLTGVGLKYMAS